MQHATCSMLSALHGCLCSATDHTDVCTPVSGADGVLRPSLLGRQRQRHCQCLNLHRNAPPQCHQTALPAWETTTATLPMSQSLSQCSSSMSSDCPSTNITMTRCGGAIHVQATTNVSASLLVDCHKSDPGLVVGGVTTLSIRWYCTLISKYALLCSCHHANYTALLI